MYVIKMDNFHVKNTKVNVIATFNDGQPVSFYLATDNNELTLERHITKASTFHSSSMANKVKDDIKTKFKNGIDINGMLLLFDLTIEKV